MREPAFEEYTTPIQRLRNGKHFIVADMLAQTRQQYELTRRTYNLLRKTQAGRAKTVYAGTGRAPSKNTKYTREDWQWMRDRSAQEIAERYNISATQAYGVKHYVRRQYSV